jgi:hypothetical protein
MIASGTRHFSLASNEKVGFITGEIWHVPVIYIILSRICLRILITLEYLLFMPFA